MHGTSSRPSKCAAEFELAHQHVVHAARVDKRAVLWPRAAGGGLLLQPRSRRRPSSGPSRPLHGLSASPMPIAGSRRCTTRGTPVKGSAMPAITEVACWSHYVASNEASGAWFAETRHAPVAAA
jgi:hypothetical protein